MKRPDFNIHLPDWLTAFIDANQTPLPTLSDRMGLAIELSKMNVTHQSGGPFAAIIYDTDTWIPFSAGVNLVTSTNYSILHAEVVAICLAHKKTNHFDLGGPGTVPLELVSSTEPCAMCIGAICWSGIKRLVYGATDADARQIGFDEGPKEKNWQTSLEKRDIHVERNVLRDDARSVLNHYVEIGGLVYNARQGSK